MSDGSAAAAPPRPQNTLARAVGFLSGACKTALAGYAQIYFAERPAVGFLFLLATMVLPDHGLAGILGLLMAQAFAALLDLPRAHIRSGFYAYNGLLQALALGLTYAPNAAFFGLLIVTSLVGVLVAAALRALFDRTLGLPVLSLPFVLTTWLMLAAGPQFHGLEYAVQPYGIELFAGSLPGPIEHLARSLGAALFQLSVPAGLLVAAGLLLHSRHAFLLAVVGTASGTALHLFLGGTLADLEHRWLGFNAALTAIAVGGVWMVPGTGATLLAAAAGAASGLVTAGSVAPLERLGLPVLAFPFVFTTQVFLYALRARIEPRRLPIVAIPAQSPEQNLKASENHVRRELGLALPAFGLPVVGSWIVTQGFDGPHTHQSLWAHAWDLEIADLDGRLFAGQGAHPEDFYCFGKPVFAPEDGKVVRIVGHLDDNPIGQVDPVDRFGNLVIVWHYGAVYTCVSHLAKGSLAVAEGDLVRRGQLLGRVGSSGRSPRPHLHFQVQQSPEVGAPTAPSRLAHLVLESGADLEYRSKALPGEGACVRPLEPEQSRFEAAGFALGSRWTYRDHRGDTETWVSEIDFAGQRSLRCLENGGRANLWITRSEVVVLDVDGPRGSGLSWLLLALPRLPLTRMNLRWSDRLPAERLMSPLVRLGFDLLEPFATLAHLESESRFVPSVNTQGFEVETILRAHGPLAQGDGLRLCSYFERQRGLVSLRAERDGREVFSLCQVEASGG